MNENLPQGIPAEVRNGLESLCSGLIGAVGDSLASVALYGGVARGRFVPARSDVNILVVLAEDTGPVLRAIASPLAMARRAIRVEPYIIATAEFQTAASAFPTRFLDMQDHNILLCGTNPFDGIVIPDEALRARTEQELRNLLIRFRRAITDAGDDAFAQATAVRRVAAPLSIEFTALLRLRGKMPPPESDLATVFRTAADHLGLDARTLTEISALRDASGSTPDAAGLCDRTLSLMHHVNSLAGEGGTP